MEVSAAGKLGGKATYKKYGREHYVAMRKKSKGRLKKKPNIGVLTSGS